MNLRTARKIEQAINTWLGDNHVDPRCVVSVFDQTPLDTFNTRRESIGLELDVVMTLTELRSNIRRAIQVANESSGINAMIASRLLVLAKQSMYTRLHEIAEREDPVIGKIDSYLSARIAQVKTSTNAYSNNNSFSVCAMSPQELEDVQKIVQGFKRELRSIDDALLTLNGNTNVGYEFTTTQNDILTKLGII